MANLNWYWIYVPYLDAPERQNDTGLHAGYTKVYPKHDVDNAIAKKDAEIAALKEMAKEPSVPNRTCRKCGNADTLMYMPIAEDGRIYWDLYNNKGIDYVFGIRCSHCGEVAFVTKQTHEYELRHQKYKRCLAMAKIAQYCCYEHNKFYFISHREFEKHKCEFYEKWRKRWQELAKKFKEELE